MKKVISALFVCLSYFSYSQQVSNENEPVQIQESNTEENVVVNKVALKSDLKVQRVNRKARPLNSKEIEVKEEELKKESN